MMGAGCAGFLAPEEMRELSINSCNISAPNCAQAETALKVPTINSGRERLVRLAELLELHRALVKPCPEHSQIPGASRV